jgi:hypothetical protein
VRLKLAQVAAAAVLTLLSLAAIANAQNPDTMAPEQSSAKAKQILKQLIDGLGGQKYLEEKTRACEGRLAQFGHNGAMTGYVDFKDFWHYPDKKRTDFAKKGNIIDLYAGNEGWTLDRSGVSEEPATAVANFQAMVQREVNNLLRHRLNEDHMLISYGGKSVVDLKQVDWVEIVDSEQRTFRLAVDRSTHLLVRSMVVTSDEETRERREEITMYTNYQPKDGIEIPLQVSRERDGRRVYQVFYTDCQVNPALPPDFFTKAALEKRYSEVGGKSAKNKSKE